MLVKLSRLQISRCTFDLFNRSLKVSCEVVFGLTIGPQCFVTVVVPLSALELRVRSLCLCRGWVYGLAASFWYSSVDQRILLPALFKSIAIFPIWQSRLRALVHSGIPKPQREGTACEVGMGAQLVRLSDNRA